MTQPTFRLWLFQQRHRADATGRLGELYARGHLDIDNPNSPRNRITRGAELRAALDQARTEYRNATPRQRSRRAAGRCTGCGKDTGVSMVRVRANRGGRKPVDELWHLACRDRETGRAGGLRKAVSGQ